MSCHKDPEVRYQCSDIRARACRVGRKGFIGMLNGFGDFPKLGVPL